MAISKPRYYHASHEASDAVLGQYEMMYCRPQYFNSPYYASEKS
jgi:hypothetical protein